MSHFEAGKAFPRALRREALVCVIRQRVYIYRKNRHAPSTVFSTFSGSDLGLLGGVSARIRNELLLNHKTPQIEPAYPVSGLDSFPLYPDAKVCYAWSGGLYRQSGAGLMTLENMLILGLGVAVRRETVKLKNEGCALQGPTERFEPAPLTLM